VRNQDRLWCQGLTLSLGLDRTQQHVARGSADAEAVNRHGRDLRVAGSRHLEAAKSGDGQPTRHAPVATLTLGQGAKRRMVPYADQRTCGLRRPLRGAGRKEV
jgi:hypothetical protein